MTTLHTLPNIPDRFPIVEFATAQIEDQAFSLFPRSLHLRVDGVLAFPRGCFEFPDLLIHFRVWVLRAFFARIYTEQHVCSFFREAQRREHLMLTGRFSGRNCRDEHPSVPMPRIQEFSGNPRHVPTLVLKRLMPFFGRNAHQAL